MKKESKKVEVTWMDSSGYGAWDKRRSAINNRKISEVKTLGYILKRNKREILVAQSIDLTIDSVDHTIIIPMGCVKEIKELGNK